MSDERIEVIWIQESRTGMSTVNYDYNIGLPLYKVNPLDGEEE